jgi:hypothetical protein
METALKPQPGAPHAEPVTQATPERRKPDIALVEAPPAGVKARQLLQEARKASLEHVAAFEAAIGEVRDLADAIVEAGDLYGPGLNDFARRLGEELFWKSKTLAALALRQRAAASSPA